MTSTAASSSSHEDGLMIPLRDRIRPASWTIVMACGVLSIDLRAVHQPALSAILLWFTAGVWLLLAAVLGAPLVYPRDRVQRETRSPVALAGVAATAVLGVRLALQDHRVSAVALLAVAAIGWALLLPPILRHWKTPTVGISFVVGVATDGLALLSATLAVTFRAGWLVTPAALLLLLGLAFYGFTLARFDLRQLISGHGDHWIAGGALAIAALSAGKVTEAARTLDRLRHLQQILGPSTLALWCLAMVWLPVLIVSEVVRPRLGYDVRRWATVFPFGMYAACSFTAGQVTGTPGIIGFGRVWTWVAGAVALVVFAGLFHHLYQAWRLTDVSEQPAAGALSVSKKGRYDGP
ncbi:tellurite resistance/C4-dicarboxylate transporter family protein [Amycolatopsis sp. H6(2020)]|nr:tellurite resistance/C4-dicarboxylate transporter family protein [Amycolatopsis sp. H6(2020)]